MRKEFNVPVDKKAYVGSSKYIKLESELPDLITIKCGDVLRIRGTNNFKRLGRVANIINGIAVTDRFRILKLDDVVVVGDRHICGINSWLFEYKQQ